MPRLNIISPALDYFRISRCEDVAPLFKELGALDKVYNMIPFCPALHKAWDNGYLVMCRLIVATLCVHIMSAFPIDHLVALECPRRVSKPTKNAERRLT